ncbi:MAG: TldD/PmbA family protein [Planctomycetes bacterium]|nr:TldD/PmbA family protein [Planctomycetota bacterium]
MKERFLSLLKGLECDYAEIRFEDTSKNSFRFSGKELENVNESQSSGFAIRALVDGNWGFATFNDPNELEMRLKQAVAAAQAAAKHSRHPFQLAPVDVLDLTIKAEPVVDPRAVPLADKLDLFGGYNKRILANEGITSSRVVYFDSFSRVVFANSEGTFVDREAIDLACSVNAIAMRGGDTRTGGVSQGSRNNFDIMRGLDSEVDEAVEEALGKLDAKVVKAGTYTVVCDPHLAGVFVHEAFGHLSEGDNLANDPAMQEILTLGREFGSEHLHIYDSGLDVGMRGHVPVDDEGVLGQNTDLIKGGKLVGRLHSRETAGKLGEKATGNGRAITYRHPPIPRMRNTCIAPGPDGTLEDLVKGVELGIYAVDAYGGQTNGELFTFTAGDAFMIRNGEIAERVKDVTISGNVFNTLRNIDAIGSGFGNRDSAGGCGKAGQMPLPVSHGSPEVRIQECVIGGE